MEPHFWSRISCVSFFFSPVFSETSASRCTLSDKHVLIRDGFGMTNPRLCWENKQTKKPWFSQFELVTLRNVIAAICFDKRFMMCCGKVDVIITIITSIATLLTFSPLIALWP